MALPPVRIGLGPAALTPRLRLVSSPDFLNADIGDLARRPGFWTPGRSANGINGDHRRAIDMILADWQKTDPDGVFVAGDLVDGRWGRDSKGTGNFGPVHCGSSQLHLMGGANSAAWKLFEKYDVDLYLAGEAHDVTVLEKGGVTQIVHGGLFQFGLTNALLLDVYDNFIYLTLRDYDVRHRDAADGAAWETVREGMPVHLKVRNHPFGLGTGVLHSEGLRNASGLLRPGL